MVGALSEWHLVGPLLASLIVCLGQRMRLSRPRIRDLMISPTGRWSHHQPQSVRWPT